MGNLRRSIGLHVLLACALGTSASVFARTWTDDSGKYSVKAELVDVGKDTVWLKRGDGKTITVPIARLSTADRAVVTKNRRIADSGWGRTPSTRGPTTCIFAEVTAVPREDTIEISVGSDDGLHKGDEFVVFRPSTNKYIGCVEVIQCDSASHAVCRPDPKRSAGPIQKGDEVHPMPKSAKPDSAKKEPAQPTGK